MSTETRLVAINCSQCGNASPSHFPDCAWLVKRYALLGTVAEASRAMFVREPLGEDWDTLSDALDALELHEATEFKLSAT